MSSTMAHNRNNPKEFVVVCPSHPEITLLRRQRTLFGRRVQVFHEECPLCRTEHPAIMADGTPILEHQATVYGEENDFQPSAPFADQHHHFGSALDGGYGYGNNSQRSSITSSYATASARTSTTSTSYQPPADLKTQLMEMVFSLLECEHGENEMVEKLDIICAWSLPDEETRLTILDAGGIYILTSLLQQCQEIAGPRPTPSSSHPVEMAAHSVAPSGQAPLRQPSHRVSNHRIPTRDDVTLATETMVDDNTTIVTNDGDLEETMREFDLQNGLAHPTATMGHSLYGNSGASAYGTAHSVAGSTLSNTHSRAPSMTSYPGSMYLAPSANTGGPRSSGSSTPQHTNPVPNVSAASHASVSSGATGTPFVASQHQAAHASVAASHSSVATGNPFAPSMQPQPHNSHISPPPPTMNDLDRAFGHFLVPSASDTATGGRSETAWTASAASGMPTAGDATVVTSHYGPSTVHHSSSSHIHPTQPSASESSVRSVSRYVSPRTPGTGTASVAPNAALPANVAEGILQEVRWSVATLANLSQDTISVDIFRSAGGVECLLSTMTRFEDDEMVQDCGCECLTTIISGEGEQRIHMKGLISSFGGVSGVLRAMRLFPSTPTLQNRCCVFLRKMVQGDAVVLQTIVTLRGIELLTLTMRMHRLDEKLQEEACLTLNTLMQEGEQIYAEVVHRRGAESILAAMWQFEANHLIQLNGCEALGRMCQSDDGNKHILTDQGSVSTVLLAMRNFGDRADIQRAGCRTLCHLTTNYDPATQACIDENALETLRSAAVHDPVYAKQLRVRLYQYRSRVFKPC